MNFTKIFLIFFVKVCKFFLQKYYDYMIIKLSEQKLSPSINWSFRFILQGLTSCFRDASGKLNAHFNKAYRAPYTISMLLLSSAAFLIVSYISWLTALPSKSRSATTNEILNVSRYNRVKVTIYYSIR